MNKKVEVLPNLSALVQQALALTLERLNQAIQERGQGTIVLAGGNTPKPLYEALATQPLPWDKIHVFWGDERYVPPDHPDSNQGMARQAWLDHVAIPAHNIHPMVTDEADPTIAAAKHEAELRNFFKDDKDIPVFDLILLGMGDDGHTASLFPHTEALRVRDRLVTVGQKEGQPRITFTVPLINQARCVIFMAAGSGKQGALSHIFADEADDRSYPARLIQPVGELWWLLDEAAGKNLQANLAS